MARGKARLLRLRGDGLIAAVGPPYREPGKATGLPFPRNGARAFDTVIGLLALAAVCAPLVLVGDAIGVLNAIRLGGAGMWPLVLSAVASACVVLALGVLLVRGRKLPVAAVVGAALVPILVALIGEIVVHRQVAAALVGESIEPGTRLRIAFEGMAEETNAPLYAAIACSLLLLSAANGAAGVAGTVDHARLSFRSGPLWLLSLAFSITWMGLGLAWVISTKAMSGGLAIVVVGLVAQIVVTLLAVVVTRASVSLPGWHDADEARHIAGAIVCAALASSLCMVLVDRAVLLFVERQMWSAVSDAGVDASQRARLLHEWVVAQRTFSRVTLVHGIGTLCSFAPAIIRAHGRGTSAVSRSAVVAFGLFVATVVAFYGVTSQRAELLRQCGMLARIDTVFNGNLPVVHDGTSLPLATRNPRVLHLRGLRSTPTTDSVNTVATEGDTSLGAVVLDLDFTAYFGEARELTLEIVVRSELPLVQRALDPEIAVLVPTGPPVVAVRLMIATSKDFLPRVELRRDDVLVTPATGAPHRILRGASRTEQLRAGVDATPSSPEIHIVAQHTTTLQELVSVVVAFDRGWERVVVHLPQPESPAGDGQLLPKP